MARSTLTTYRQVHRVLLLIVLLLATSTGSSQQKQNTEAVIRISTDLVTFSAHVLSKKTGRPAVGLRKGDLILYEDGIKQEITHFRQDESPLSIVILVDDSGSVGPVLDEIHAASRLALQQLKPKDEISLMAFSSTAWLVQDFTEAREKIIEKIAPDKLTPIIGVENVDFSGDGTHIADSIYLAAKHFSKAANPLGRRSIIVVTDDWANNTTYTEEEVTEQLFESGATVYGLIIGRQHVIDRYILPQSLGRKTGGNATTYANKTGGVALNGRDHKVVERLSQIIGLLRQQYSLGYLSTNPQMDGRFRKIKLEVTPEVEKREGGVIILAKQGYYARPRNADKPAAGPSAVPKKN